MVDEETKKVDPMVYKKIKKEALISDINKALLTRELYRELSDKTVLAQALEKAKLLIPKEGTPGIKLEAISIGVGGLELVNEAKLGENTYSFQTEDWALIISVTEKQKYQVFFSGTLKVSTLGVPSQSFASIILDPSGETSLTQVFPGREGLNLQREVLNLQLKKFYYDDRRVGTSRTLWAQMSYKTSGLPPTWSWQGRPMLVPLVLTGIPSIKIEDEVYAPFSTCPLKFNSENGSSLELDTVEKILPLFEELQMEPHLDNLLLYLRETGLFSSMKEAGLSLPSIIENIIKEGISLEELNSILRYSYKDARGGIRRVIYRRESDPQKMLILRKESFTLIFNIDDCELVLITGGSDESDNSETIYIATFPKPATGYPTRAVVYVSEVKSLYHSYYQIFTITPQSFTKDRKRPRKRKEINYQIEPR